VSTGLGPLEYRVVVSGRVSTEVQALTARATAAGHREVVLAALRTIDRMLRFYPQFGEPLQELEALGETVYAAAIPPLCVKYSIDESLRTVFVVVPMRVLPNSGFA
jgi:hypothetical protein